MYPCSFMWWFLLDIMFICIIIKNKLTLVSALRRTKTAAAVRLGMSHLTSYTVYISVFSFFVVCSAAKVEFVFLYLTTHCLSFVLELQKIFRVRQMNVHHAWRKPFASTLNLTFYLIKVILCFKLCDSYPLTFVWALDNQNPKFSWVKNMPS